MLRLRRPIALVALVGLAAVVATVLLLRGGGSPTPPATGAARLVPADALAYAHVSTDPDRDAVRRADDLLARLPAVAAARDAVVARLTTIGPGLSYAHDVRPWLGPEAALALLPAAGSAATPLAVLAVADRGRAQAFLERSTARPSLETHAGVRMATYGSLSTAFVGRYLVAGPAVAVRTAIDCAQGRAPGLARSALFARATRALPAGRAADAFLSRDGVIRLLADQRGALGAAGSLLAQPRLAATGMALSAQPDGAHLRVRTVLGPAGASGASRAPAFAPRLPGAVPADALAYLGLARLDRSAASLLGGLAAGAAPGLGELLARAEGQARRSGVDLRRDLLPLVQGEVALWLKSASPAPVLTLIAATRDARATSDALGRLARALSVALTPPRSGPGQAPVVEERQIAGVPAFALRLGPTAQVLYAVWGGKVVVSTAPEGIADVRRGAQALPDSADFRATLGGHPPRVTSLVFLDFSQLLGLGERSGLSGNPAYLAVRGDLRKVKALGAATTGGEDESTTEISLLIP